MDHLLSTRARKQTTSAIRDLLEQAQRPGMISLAGGLPDPDRFPREEMASLATQCILDRDTDALQYGLTAGDARLREAIVASTPAATHVEHVLVTTGSQQALHLLSEVLLDPGDTVVVGDPDYLGALQAFRSSGATLAPVDIDVEGLVVEQVAEQLRAGIRPKFIYVVPHFHNPTGATLSTHRRDELLVLASRYNFLVVFDDPYRDLAVDQPAPEPAPHPHAVHLRSVSKILAPGLRVGWMIGPPWLLRTVERAKQSADLHTSSLSQAIALGAITAPWFPAHLAALSAATATKRDALVDALINTFGDRLTLNRPGGGMFVWAEFTDGTDTSALLDPALNHGVAFVPGPAFAVERDLTHHLRLSWATASPAELEEAVGRLAAAHATPAG
ncbi:MAG: 2-aminoadipate transaminase [Candidatus Aldehydirespiratoraceae bacterium]|jgi:2-aminoadipate transaminase